MINLSTVQKIIVDSLEKPDEDGFLNGDYVVHEDVPSTPPPGMDRAFTVVGDEADGVIVVYLMFIPKEDL